MFEREIWGSYQITRVLEIDDGFGISIVYLELDMYIEYVLIKLLLH